MVSGVRLEAELVGPEEHLQVHLTGVRDRADGVDARELVDVALETARDRRVALAEEPLELGADDRQQAVGRIPADDPGEQRARARRPVVGAVEAPGLAEAPRHLRLPRDDAQRLRVRPDREVDVALLAPDDGGMAQVGAHHGGAERDALVQQLDEVADRDVLPARDAVQVGVEQADRPHALAAERCDRRLGVVTVGHAIVSWSLTRAPGRACA